MSSAKSSARITQLIRRRRCCRRPCKNMWNKLFEIRSGIQIVTTVQMYHVCLGGSELSPLLFRKNTSAGTSRWSVWISPQLMNSFVGSGFMSGPLPPALTNTEKGSFTSMQMWHTHTPCRSRVLFGRNLAAVICCTNFCIPSIQWNELASVRKSICA